MKKLTVYLVFAMLVVSSLSMVFTGIVSADAGYEADIYLLETGARGETATEWTSDVKRIATEEKGALQEYRVLELTSEEPGLSDYDQISADAGAGF